MSPHATGSLERWFSSLFCTLVLQRSILQEPIGSHTTVQTCHLKELTQGKFLINSENITLMDSIGEGVRLPLSIYYFDRLGFLHITGEFGVVYMAIMGRLKKVVAVKTLKG